MTGADTWLNVVKGKKWGMQGYSWLRGPENRVVVFFNSGNPQGEAGLNSVEEVKNKNEMSLKHKM